MLALSLEQVRPASHQVGQAQPKIFLLAGDLSGGLPGSNVTRSDLPDGPKPGQAVKNLPSGSAGSQVSGQVQIS